MAKIKIDIKNLPMWAQIVSAVVPAVLFIGIFGYFSTYPKFKTINTLKQEISKQENEIKQSTTMAEKLAELKAENLRLKQRLEELAKQLPEEKEISILLTNLSDLGKQVGLNISAWKPTQKKTLHSSGIVFEAPFAVEFTGSYHRLAVFFSSLTRLDRIINIAKIQLSDPKPAQGESVLKVNFSAVTFTAATEGGLSNAASAGAKGGVANVPAGGAR